MGIEDLSNLIVPAFNIESLTSIGVPEHEINDFARFKLIPVELLVNASWNYKEDDATIDKKLEANIKRQGQTENINVRLLNTGYYEVGNGNHRNNIFTKNGRKYALCCDHGDISEAEFKRRVIEQNETRYKTNTISLAELISELSQSYNLEDLEESMPHAKEDLEDMMELLKFNWDDYKNNPDDTGAETELLGKEEDKLKEIIISLTIEEYERWTNIVSLLDLKEKDCLMFLIDNYKI